MSELMEDKRFKWSKFLGGLKDPVSYAKGIVHLVQIGLVITIISLIAFGVIYIGKAFLWKEKEKPNVTTTTLGEGSIANIYNAPPEARLTQGIYTRGSTDFDGVRGEVGVFKELTTHFEVELGGGVHREDKQNDGFVNIGCRVKF